MVFIWHSLIILFDCAAYLCHDFETACKQLMSTLHINFVCLSTVLAIWLKRKISDSLNTKFAKWSQFLDLAAGWASDYVGSILFSIPRMGLVKWLSCLSLAAFLKGNLHYCSLSPKKHRSSTFPAFGISAYALCGLWLLAIDKLSTFSSTFVVHHNKILMLHNNLW
jgi:hypothetical protein